MTKGKLQQLDEQVKSQHKYWESLSPEERRASVIKMRDTLAKNTRKSMIFLGIIGILFSFLTIHYWRNEYNFSPESSLGIVGGMILVGFGFWYVESNRIKSYSKIQSNDFSDDDIVAYLREHEEGNRKALEQWNKYQYFVFVFGGLFMLLLYLQSTKGFAFMMLISSISIFLVGIVIFFLIQRVQNK